MLHVLCVRTMLLSSLLSPKPSPEALRLNAGLDFFDLVELLQHSKALRVALQMVVLLWGHILSHALCPYLTCPLIDVSLAPEICQSRFVFYCVLVRFCFLVPPMTLCLSLLSTALRFEEQHLLLDWNPPFVSQSSMNYTHTNIQSTYQQDRT